MKAVAYLRISQEDENIENQLIKIKEYCEQKGYELVGVFKDIAVSGTKATETREGFKSMLKFCEDNKVKVIIFYDISRMSRNVLDGLKTLKELTEKGYQVKFVAQQFLDYIEDPMLKKKVLMDFLWFAEFYVEDIRRRTKIGLERAKKGGKKLGRPYAIRGEKLKQLKVLLEKGVNISSIAKILSVSRGTVYNTIKRCVRKT